MRRLIAVRLALAQGFVEQTPALTGHAGRPRNRPAELVELAREILERRLELPPQRPAALGEEQISGQRADDAAHDGRCYCSVVHRTRLHAERLRKPTPALNRVQVVCHEMMSRTAARSIRPPAETAKARRISRRLSRPIVSPWPSTGRAR